MTQTMNAARSYHTATLLPSGKVLVIGGCKPTSTYHSEALKTAELFDPATGTFSETGNMGFLRYKHTATLLPNGKVLVAGGCGVSADPNQAAMPAHNTAELFDPASGTFSRVANMSYFRWDGHSASLLANGKVLIAGGYDATAGNIGSIANAELFDPATETFSATGSMTSRRSNHAAVILADGKVLVAEGVSGVNGLNNAELYDPALGTFSPTSAPGDCRVDFTATVLESGKVLLVGGSNFESVARLYDPATKSYAATGDLQVPRIFQTATRLSDGKVLIAGGTIFNEYNTPEAEAWMTSLGMVKSPALESLFFRRVEIYDPATGTFGGPGLSLAELRTGHTATLLGNGKVLIAGGAGVKASFELYPAA